MSREQVEEFRKYFAGASVAFGLPFLTLEFLGLFFSSSTFFQSSFNIIFLVLHLIGGVIGGYLTVRRTDEEEIRAGLVTGFLGFIIQQGVYAIFYGLRSLGDIYSFVGLLGGALAGALLWRLRKS